MTVLSPSVPEPHKPEEDFRPLLAHVFWNGLGFYLLGETTVLLMAIHLNASPFLLSLLGAMPLLAGLILFFSPRIYGGRRPVRLFRLMWGLRGWVCAGYFLIPFVPAAAGLAVLFAVYAVFCSVRMVGAVLFPILQRGVAPPELQGALISRQAIAFNLTGMVSRCVSAVVVTVPFLSGMGGLLLLEALGMGANATSVAVMKKFPALPPMETRRGLALGGWIGDVRRWLRDPLTRWPLLTAPVMTAVLVLFAMNVAVMTKTLGFSTTGVFLYALLFSVGAAAWGWIGERVLEGTKVRQIGALAAALAALTFLGWGWIGAGFSRGLLLASAPLQGVLMTVVGNVTQRMFLVAMPDSEAAHFSATTTLLSSVAALIAGLLGGWLAEWGFRHAGFPGNAYRLVFLAAALAALATAVTLLRSKTAPGRPAPSPERWTPVEE